MTRDNQCEDEMNFDEYQIRSSTTAIYPNQGKNLIYPVLGLCGESGEVAEKVKKLLRDKDGILDEADRQALKKELGDVLWYLSQIATELDISLGDVAQDNLDKLASRKSRNVIGGSGDNR